MRALFLVALFGIAGFVRGVEFPGAAPGRAEARREASRTTLFNNLLSATWEGARLVEVVDRTADRTIRRAKPDAPWQAAEPPALAKTPDGWKIECRVKSRDGVLAGTWQAILRDGSNYARQIWTVTGQGAPELELLNLPLPNAALAGQVEGSPLVSGNLFLGAEHPMARNRVERGSALCSVGTFRTLKPGETCQRSAVIGVAAPGQLRRSFLYYLERERPRPYKPFLHYNSWYDIAWGDRKMTEKQCVDVIEAYGKELIRARGVKLDAFVFDDGWDDNQTLWRFHGGFPRGFTPVREAAERYGSAVGVWLSPWGGYGPARDERLKFGKTQGFETNRNGFALSGAKYYGQFRDACVEMVEKYGANYFKFDGIAAGIDSQGAGREFAGDVESLLVLLKELRARRPDIYLSITTGTWPSPWWLFYGDSIWRNGGDMGFAGAGSKRQQWITYRDMIEYRSIVQRAPLYPVSSLMTQGIAQANLGDASLLGNDLKEWKNEVRSFFASGTQLQELYITPGKLTPEMWDVLAEAANWLRRRSDVLADVHWIGGDPGKGHVYGFAAWNKGKGTLMLRNPAPAPGQIALDIAKAFELPAGAATKYRLMRPWADERQKPAVELRAGQPHQFQLEPFEVFVADAEAAD